MEITAKRQRSNNPQTYYQFTLIDIQFINTFQIWSINLTLFNFFLKIFHDKKNPSKTLVWLKSVIIGEFRYKYEYVSPFGEYWRVYRRWFGFIPIKYTQMVYENMYDDTEIEKYVNKLNDEHPRNYRLFDFLKRKI